jgi:diazepam-binding inhibitor (GABA receptor modulating acyl-CoA-binding protein)
MADLNERFQQATAAAKQLPDKPDNETLLNLYALYKQGSEGDVSGEKPSFFDFVATAKYEAWTTLQGRSSEDAMQQYIELVESLGGTSG